MRDKLLDALMQVKSSLHGGKTYPLVQNFFKTEFPKLTNHKNHILGITAGIGVGSLRLKIIRKYNETGFRNSWGLIQINCK